WVTSPFLDVRIEFARQETYRKNFWPFYQCLDGLLARISHTADSCGAGDMSIWGRQRGGVALKARLAI
ncbi:MAG: hypothetical protein P8Z80_20505, partial [Pseudolabrys sp.]